MTRRTTRAASPKRRRGTARGAQATVLSSGSGSPSAWMLDVGGGRRTPAGERVTEERAMALSTYWACLNDISQDLGKLPLQLRRRRDKRGSDEATDHAVWRLVRRKPNPVMGSMVFRMVLQHRAMAWGNAYAEITRDQVGRPTSLWPVHPSRMRPKLLEDGETLVYEYRPDGKFHTETLQARDVLHIRGMGTGIEGYSVLRFASDSLGLGLAAQTHAGAFYGEGMGKRMVAISKTVLNPQGREEFRRRVKGDNENDPVGARKLPFLEGDIDLKELGIPPDQAQFLESRTFSVSDVARWFRMALAKLQHSERAQGWSTLESLNRDYATDALQPWAQLTEEEFWAKLLTEQEQGAERLYFKHVFNALLRADFGARMTGYVQGIQNGIYSQNDVREFEDLNPIADPAADEYRQQKQMAKLGAGDEEPDPDPQGGGQPPAPPSPPAEEDEEDDAAQALRPIFLQAATRLVRKELHATRRALQQHASNAEAYRSWTEEFLKEQAADAAEAFGAPLQVRGALGGGVVRRPVDFAALLRGLGPIGTNVDEAARAAQLVDALLAPPSLPQEPAHA